MQLLFLWQEIRIRPGFSSLINQFNLMMFYL